MTFTIAKRQQQQQQHKHTHCFTQIEKLLVTEKKILKQKKLGNFTQNNN